MSKIGVLLTNTGTPDSPTPGAVRRYLREFLSDKRIVQLPRIIWLPILYCLILPLRPRRSAKLYANIWQPQGSPMRVIMQNIRSSLSETWANNQHIEIELGMNYGQPSIQDGLHRLREKQVDKIIVLPLFPQYSHTTTASSFDRVKKAIRKWGKHPEVILIDHYADLKEYIDALAANIQHAWTEKPKAEHLLISFHGIPKRFIAAGDPYETHCIKTAHLLAEKLNLKDNEWTLCYQSQFGYDKWLQPSTQVLFTELPKKGIKHIDVVCPGFSVDCLETLEEIAITGKEMFLHAGGESLRYIPALNETNDHLNVLKALIQSR